MTCQRCKKAEAIARVVSYAEAERVMDLPVCRQCLMDAQRLGLQEMPLMEAQDEK